ncbi:hypothetical protein BsWGS_24926 [Bradybaena similaris]
MFSLSAFLPSSMLLRQPRSTEKVILGHKCQPAAQEVSVSASCLCFCQYSTGLNFNFPKFDNDVMSVCCSGNPIQPNRFITCLTEPVRAYGNNLSGQLSPRPESKDNDKLKHSQEKNPIVCMLH